MGCWPWHVVGHHMNTIHMIQYKQFPKPTDITYIRTYIHTSSTLPGCLPALPIKPELHHLPVEGIRFWPEVQVVAALRTFANETFSSSPHRRFNLPAECGRTKAIGELHRPTSSPACARALPSGLIAALRLCCTAHGIFCKLYVSSRTPIWSVQIQTSSTYAVPIPRVLLRGEEL